jgi:hypothetical protein
MVVFVGGFRSCDLIPLSVIRDLIRDDGDGGCLGAGSCGGGECSLWLAVCVRYQIGGGDQIFNYV